MINRKWIAAILTSAMMAADIALPFSAVTAMGADPAAVEVVETAEEENSGQEEASLSDSETSADLDEEAAEETAPADSSAADNPAGSEEETSDQAETETSEQAADVSETDETANEEDAADVSEETSEEAENADHADTDSNNDPAKAAEETVEDTQAPEGTQYDETAAAAAASTEEAAADHTTIKGSKGVKGTFSPVEEGFPNYDNDDIFAAYVNREMELEGDLKADTGDFDPDDARKFAKDYASTNLTGNNLKIYNILKKEIAKVAQGTRTDTVFAVSLADLGLADKYFSAADLGVKSIVENDALSMDAMGAMLEMLKVDTDLIFHSLLADCPYELYWNDKTKPRGVYWESFNYFNADWVDGEWQIKFSDEEEYKFSFYVSQDYSASGGRDTFETDSDIGSAVSAAYNNAQNIVSSYASYSDYDKLSGYKETICDMTDYNDEAMKNDDTPYGNPWQLIWALDGDDSTNVVCEGYAKAFQYLCDLSSWNSIFNECITVTGTMNSDDHMWNIVNLRDDRSYLVDVTNCDDAMIGEGNGRTDLFLVGTGDSDSDRVYAQGNLEEGYSFNFRQYGTVLYVYDSDTRSTFEDNILTLAEGRADESTSTKPSQSLSAEDVTVEYFTTATPSVTGNEGALTFESQDTSVFTVDENSGLITPVASGSAKLVIIAKETEDYAKTSTKVTVTVTPFNLTQADTQVTLSASSFTYTGTARTPSVTSVVDANGRTMTQNTDYYVSYSNNINAGNNTAVVKITGAGLYRGVVTKKFTITKAAQSFTLKADASVPAKMITKVIASGAKETKKYNFASSNTAVAAVSASGNVTGKKAGTVTITVTTPATANYNAGKKTIKITVTAALKKPGNCHFVKWNNEKYNSCQIAWNKAAGAQGYQTLLSWTNGTHASWKSMNNKVLSQNCTVAVNHVSQLKVRAFYTTNYGRQYGPWSNVEYITPSPTKLTSKKASGSTSSNPKIEISWNIIYGCNGYNVFITTDPSGTWYWNQSTPVNATATKATITKFRGQKLKKKTKYYVRIVTRRKRNGVFCTVPMPKKNTNIGYFVVK